MHKKLKEAIIGEGYTKASFAKAVGIPVQIVNKILDVGEGYEEYKVKMLKELDITEEGLLKYQKELKEERKKEGLEENSVLEQLLDLYEIYYK